MPASHSTHLVERTCADANFSLCKPASPRANIDIAICFGVAVFLILLLYFGTIDASAVRVGQRRESDIETIKRMESGITNSTRRK